MTTPEFPNYDNPATLPGQFQHEPQTVGIPLGDPKFHKPLYKLAKLMMKPKTKMRAPKTPKVRTGRRGKKKVAFH